MNIPESLEEIQKLAADGKLSLVQICKEYIQRIKSQTLDKNERLSFGYSSDIDIIVDGEIFI